MRKILYSIFMVAVLVNMSFAYEDYVHMYITEKAYRLLKLSKCYPVYDSRIGGLNDYGNFAWNGGKITTGAYREDEEDVVFGHSGVLGALIQVSHFWNADDRSNSDYTLSDLGWVGNYKNAMEKINLYKNGNWYNADNQPQWINIYSGTGSYQYMYRSGLINFYQTGVVWCESYTNHLGQIYDVKEWRTLDDDTKNKIVWEILGRMCHLLQDMTSPAHAHCDQHAPVMGGADKYEFHTASNSIYTTFNEYTAQNQGGYINPFVNNGGSDPVRYLMYVSNQLADHYPCGPYQSEEIDVVGDNSVYNNTNGQGTYQMLTNYYSALGNPPATNVPADFDDVLFNHSIRATAGLLYWFAVSAGLQEYNGPPALQSFTFNLPQNQVYARETGTLTANFLNANYYGWQYYKCSSTANGCGNYSPLPNGLQIYGSNNKIYIRVFDDYVNQQCTTSPPNCGNQGLLRFGFKFTAYQGSCWATDHWYGSEIKPLAGLRPPPPIGGCPFIYVWNSDSTLHMTDNNLLHRSEFPEYVNQDIKDLYRLQIMPNLNFGKYSIQIGEHENDHDYFDNIKLIAVDHPIGTAIGITEANDIVMYDTTTIQSADDASQNGTNITPLIQYYYQGKKIVSGSSGDSIYAHYDSSSQMRGVQISKKRYGNILNRGIADSMALIGELDREWTPGKGSGGLCDIYLGGGASGTSVSRPFAMREIMSTVVIPFSSINDAVDHIDINWASDYSLTYFSVVPIMYSGFDIIEIPIYDAVHSVENADVKTQLLNLDQSYIELDSSDFVTIRFDSIPEPQSGMVRDYVIETNGRYTTGGSSRPFSLTGMNPVGNPYKFQLYTNYPNPFNPKTQIHFEIGKTSFVKLSIYNLLGQLVSVIVNDTREPGKYSIEFDGTNLSSGMYIYKIEAADYIEAKKMLLVK